MTYSTASISFQPVFSRTPTASPPWYQSCSLRRYGAPAPCQKTLSAASCYPPGCTGSHLGCLFWPLSRLQSMVHEQQAPNYQTLITLVWEKIPLFILSAIQIFIMDCLVTPILLASRSSELIIQFCLSGLIFWQDSSS